MESQPTAPAITPFPRWHLHVLAVWYLLPLLVTGFFYMIFHRAIIVVCAMVALTVALLIAIYSYRHRGWLLAVKMPFATLGIAIVLFLVGQLIHHYPPPNIDSPYAPLLLYFYAAIFIVNSFIYSLGSLYLKSPRAQALFNKW